MVIAAQYDEAYKFKEGMAVVKIEGKWKYIDKTGKVLIESNADYTYNFNDGAARFQKGLKFGYIDKTGKEILPATFEAAYDFSGRFSTCKNRELQNRKMGLY